MNWKPIDTAPKDGTKIVLACADDAGRESWASLQTQKGWFRYIWPGGSATMGLTFIPTHWCELPEL